MARPKRKGFSDDHTCQEIGHHRIRNPAGQ
jgi:hypothetical protein